MSLEERAVLEAGLEWEAEQTSDPGANDGASSGGNVLNLDEMAALGAEVS